MFTDTTITVDFSDIKKSLIKNDENFDFEEIFW